MRIGLDLCVSGRFIAVLPDEVARPHFDEGRLWKLPLDLVPDVSLFAYTRKRLRGESLADVLVAAVRKQVSLAQGPTEKTEPSDGDPEEGEGRPNRDENEE
jgi:DNA-binding transcriptional LysR family regulator